MISVKSKRLIQLVVLSSLLIGTATQARAATTLEMAYMPIVPCSQLFVMEGMGWAKEAGLNLKLTRFPNGPAIVQAIASGNMDVMCFGIGPAMVSRAKGINIKVIAPGIVEQIAVIAQGDLVKYFDKYSQKEALLQFAKDKGLSLGESSEKVRGARNDMYDGIGKSYSYSGASGRDNPLANLPRRD